MPYKIETFDDPDRAHVRRERYEEHLAFLDEHRELLLACGAKLTDDGSSADGGVYLVALESREEAEAFIAADPFSLGGLFRRVDVQRWRQAYLNGTCFL